MTSILAARSRALGLLSLAGLILIAGLMAGNAVEAAGNGTIQISPAAQTVGASFPVTIETNVDVAISGAQTDFTFDRTKLQIASVAPGTVWNGAGFVAGVAPQTQAQAIAEANTTTGRLENVALFFEPGTTVPVGTHTFVTIAMTSNQCGAVSLGVAAGEINDVNGAAATVTHTGGNVTTSIDTDADGQCNGIDTDDDNDGFTDVVEVSAGTNPLMKCGVDAWPADINNNGFSDTSDIAALTGVFGQPVPPAPARNNIAPSPPDGFVDTQDIARLTGLFGLPCPPGPP